MIIKPKKLCLAFLEMVGKQNNPKLVCFSLTITQKETKEIAICKDKKISVKLKSHFFSPIFTHKKGKRNFFHFILFSEQANKEKQPGASAREWK